MGYDNFYENMYSGGVYADTTEMQEHPYCPILKEWLTLHPELVNARYLEIGSGRGALQDIVSHYTGVDYAGVVSKYYHKTFVQCSASDMRIEDDAYDVAWSYAVWEHLPDPEQAFWEVVRVVKDGGYFLLSPAWHCRPWAADGLQVRPYSDFNIIGKIYKFCIPFLEWLPLRAFVMFFKRVAALFVNRLNGGKLIYKKLRPNYNVFWVSDSDACNDLDPFMVILWFKNRGCECVSHPTLVRQFFSRTGNIIFQIKK